MKKIIAALLVISMLFCLAACKQDAASNDQTVATTTSELTKNTEITEDTEPVINDIIPEQAPMAAVSLPVSVTESYTEDDVLLFTYRCQTISLIIPDAEIEDKVIIDFQNRLDDFSESAQSLNLQSQNDYKSASNWNPYFFNILYSPTRIDHAVLSMFGNNISWAGGAHPTHNCTSANYDLITGDVLTLGSILTHEDALDDLCGLLIDSVAEIKAEKFIMSDYEDTIRTRLIQNESYNEAWYFDNNGINFYFSPYEIAPYSSGVITVNIPYEKLVGIIEDRYFPPESDVTTGTIKAIKHADADAAQFTQIAEIIIDKEGEMIFLYTDKSVQNVSIEYGYWNDSQTVFSTQCTVFATPCLTPGDAAMIQLSSSDAPPCVRLKYESNQETIVEYIVLNQDNGSILLLKENDI